MTENVLELDDVAIAFSRIPLLNGLKLSVASGERVVIMGPSGSGKTTLLKLAAGLLSPDSGSVRLWGAARRSSHAYDLGGQAQRVGMLFQKNALFDSFSVLENVVFPLMEVRKLSRVTATETALRHLANVGLDLVTNHRIHEISGGMQKRLGIARAVALEPEFLLYDDPTAGLDPITSRKIADLIINLQAQTKATCLIVINDTVRAIQLGTRLWFCNEGRVEDMGDPKSAVEFPKATLGEFLGTRRRASE